MSRVIKFSSRIFKTNYKNRIVIFAHLFPFLSFSLKTLLNMSTTLNEAGPSYSHIKMVASDLDGTLVVHGVNG